MRQSLRVLLPLALMLWGVSSAQNKTQHSVNTPPTKAFEADSYAVYSALVSQRYWDSGHKTTPLRIAAYTMQPDRSHGDLMARCTSGARNESDRELVRQLLSGNLQPQKIEAKLKIPGRYLIVEGRVNIPEGKEPGLVWLSPIAFSTDKQDAMVWARNFCGGLCGSGLMWKMKRTAAGWRIVGTIPNCGFIS